ncbi:C6 transcription factor [Fusarium sp. Ph1]|nr:C6 transcription factor [Fusarium sp. Ph1]
MTSTVDSGGPKPKRLRAAQACDLCRVKKNKCDEQYPCSHCRSRNARCVYRGDDVRGGRSQTDYISQLENRVNVLSAALAMQGNEALVAKPAQDGPDIQGPPVGSVRGIFDGDLLPPGSPSQEVYGVNKHTHNIEFYGSFSSVVLLSKAQKASLEEKSAKGDDDEVELVSSLHNPFFPTRSEAARSTRATPPGSSTYYQQCRPFLDTFFTTLHYLVPMIDKADFLAKCSALWEGATGSTSQSFVALYLSILSLGALLAIRDEELIDGIESLQWSRIFFEEARSRASTNLVTDIEMVQCYFILAKICQNELNLHSAYMYGGIAIRTALAIGMNREPQPGQKRDPALSRAESRTWWCLYSLEIEMAFAMGRPDSLGADVYHNRSLPAIRGDSSCSNTPSELMEPPHCAIIKAMVDFARVTNQVVLRMYLTDSGLEKSIEAARELEQDLDRWLEALPAQIRPQKRQVPVRPLRAIKEPQYAKRQRLVLKIRYHNVRTLLFGSFLTKSSLSAQSASLELHDEVAKCLDSAKQTIEIIYETCQHQDFFRTWFYNTMYTLFATSIILIYIPQESNADELAYLYKLVEMAIEILEMMDESVVAMEAARVIQGALARTRTTLPKLPRDAMADEFEKNSLWINQAALCDLMGNDLGLDMTFPPGEPFTFPLANQPS